MNGPLLLLLASLAPAVPQTAGVPSTAEPDTAVAGLARAVVSARSHAALAAAGGWYLALDPASGTLHLMTDGTRLRDFHVSRIELGQSRATGRGASESWDVLGLPSTGGRLDPPLRIVRDVVVSDQVESPDLTATAAVIPPAPEERTPAPHRFRIDFAEGTSVEVRTDVAPDPLAVRDLWWRLRDWLGSAVPRAGRGFRVRLTMPEADAGALYRSLPDSVGFFILAQPPR